MTIFLREKLCDHIHVLEDVSKEKIHCPGEIFRMDLFRRPTVPEKC